MGNLDEHTAEGFDLIWKLHGMPAPGEAPVDNHEAFNSYFSIFPVDRLSGAEGFELGCGNGRIARFVAPRAGFLHCIDPSRAGLAAAAGAMSHLKNVGFHQASVDSIPLGDGTQEFGYSVGVLHHIPNPEAGLRSCVQKLKHGAPFLLYVYYNLDNRPRWFRSIWRLSNLARLGISKLPFRARSAASTLLAATIYWPLTRVGRLLRKMGVSIENLPLSIYVNHNWGTLRADALDRFGTAVEHRFSKGEVEAMMHRAGLQDVHFAAGPPFWIAVGYKS